MVWWKNLVSISIIDEDMINLVICNSVAAILSLLAYIYNKIIREFLDKLRLPTQQTRNTGMKYSVDLILVHRFRRWPNIN